MAPRTDSHAPTRRQGAEGDLCVALLDGVLVRAGRRRHPALAVLEARAWPKPFRLLDIGAGDGGLLEGAIALWGDDVRIDAVEPDPVAAARLTARWAGDPRVRVHAVALGNRNGQGLLTAPVLDGFRLAELGATSATGLGAWPAILIAAGGGGGMLRMDRAEVRVRRLDSLDLAPDVVRLDCAGAEADVILGGADVLRARAPAIVLPVSRMTPRLAARLGGLGYRAAPAPEGAPWRLWTVEDRA